MSTPMLLPLISLILLAFFAAAAIVGGAGAVRSNGRRRLLGVALLAQSLLFGAIQVLLSTVPLLGLTPSIPVDLGALLASAGGSLLAIGIGAGLAWALWAGLRRRLAAGRRGPLAAALLAVPLIAVVGLAGLWQLSTPERVRERDPNLRAIQVPEGFRSQVFVQGTIDNPTSLAFGPQAELYIGDIAGGIWVARDANRDGVADSLRPFADSFRFLTGLVWHEGELYVASQGKVEALRDTNDDGSADVRRLVVDGLPSMVYIPHTNNALAFGPDGRLYFGVGSTSGGETESNPLAAGILSVNPDGSDLQVYARGLSNSFDVAFNAAGDMFAADNQPGAEASANEGDELNQIVQGAHYGYPYYYGDAPDPGTTRAPVASFPPHSSPNGLTFYNAGQFPAEYADNLFIALWSTGEVYRVEMAKTASGAYLTRSASFAQGFVYPLDVAVGPDGSLYVADFGTSAVYRISYGS